MQAPKSRARLWRLLSATADFPGDAAVMTRMSAEACHRFIKAGSVEKVINEATCCRTHARSTAAVAAASLRKSRSMGARRSLQEFSSFFLSSGDSIPTKTRVKRVILDWLGSQSTERLRHEATHAREIDKDLMGGGDAERGASVSPNRCAVVMLAFFISVGCAVRAGSQDAST